MNRRNPGAPHEQNNADEVKFVTEAGGTGLPIPNDMAAGSTVSADAYNEQILITIPCRASEASRHSQRVHPEHHCVDQFCSRDVSKIHQMEVRWKQRKHQTTDQMRIDVDLIVLGTAETMFDARVLTGLVMPRKRTLQ